MLSRICKASVVALSFLVLQPTMAALPVGENVNFTGGGTNQTYSVDWVGSLTLKVGESSQVSGFIDADGLPGGRTICGSGNLSGTKTGKNISFSYTSYDPDPGCSFDQGVSRTYTGSLSEDEKRFSGTYAISNGQGGVFSFSTNQSEEACEGQSELKSHYERLKSISSNEAAFAHQFECISRKSCEDLQKNGPSSWANGFTEHVFDSMRTADGLAESVKSSCPEILTSRECFDLKGEVHREELKRAFSSYCQYTSYFEDDSDFYEKWDQGHKGFLENAVLPCFDEVVDAGELPEEDRDSLKLTILVKANIGREAVQDYVCPFSLDTILARDFKMAKLIEKKTLEKEDYYSDVMAKAGSLKVVLTPEDFFVDVGANHQILVTNRVTGEEFNLDQVEYEVILGKGLVGITDDGLVEVISTSEPYVNLAAKVYILVKSGESYGIGQIAITDSDRDEDGLVDSYEKAHGLYRFSANDREKDSDKDSLPDVFEAMYGTHPKEKDTDGDNYSDGFEYHMKSYPLDITCNPIDGCESDDSDSSGGEEETPTKTGTEDTSGATPEATTSDDSDSGGGAMLWLPLLAILGLMLLGRGVTKCRK